jgi:hypothetical protein
MKVASMTTRISATAVAALVAGLFTMSPAPSLAQTKTLSGTASRSTASTSATKQYFNNHPKVKSATIGAGVGAGVGAVGGLVTGKGVLRGAALGAGTGTGVGLIQSSETMKRHPVMKDIAQGTLVGAGLGLATHRGHGTAKKTTQTAVAGAAVGLGVGLWKSLR